MSHRTNALDYGRHNRDGAINQDADQYSKITQKSKESIYVKDSCDITIKTTDTQIGASIQAALQVAIALVVNITIADGDRAEKVTQELLQKSKIKQANRQKLIIENCYDVDVKTTDTDIAISIQLLLQILLALLINIDIL